MNGWMDRRRGCHCYDFSFFLFSDYKKQTRIFLRGKGAEKSSNWSLFNIKIDKNVSVIQQHIFYFPFHRSRYYAGIMRWSMKKNFALLNFFCFFWEFFSHKFHLNSIESEGKFDFTFCCGLLVIALMEFWR